MPRKAKITGLGITAAKSGRPRKVRENPTAQRPEKTGTRFILLKVDADGTHSTFDITPVVKSA